MKVTLVSGPQGAGKTTVLELVPPLFPHPESVKIFKVNYEIKNMARRDGKEIRTTGELSREEIIHYTDEFIEGLRGERARLIFLEGHAVRVNHENKVEIVASDSYLQIVDLYVSIRTDLKTILRRNETDAEPELSVDLVSKERDAEFEVTRQLATKASKPLVAIDNDSSPNVSALKVYNAVKDLLPHTIERDFA